LKVYRDIRDLPEFRDPSVTTGTFDGVHRGHRQIIDRLTASASKSGGESIIITFFPHPRMVLFPEDNDLKLLNTQDEKISLLEKAGVDNLIIIPFTREFSRLSSVEFVRDILVNRLGTKKLVIGYDHHFGRNREGSFEHLNEYGPVYGFNVEEIPKQLVDDVAVSSTKIRNCLLAGEVEDANTYLGYEFFFTGTVVKGNQLGRTIGYPTANIQISDRYKIIPADGVYAVRVTVSGESYKGMMNIGVRPVIGGTPRTIEVNIFDFNKDIYSSEITVHLVSRLREEQNFPSLDALKVQLDHDKQDSLRIL
jgi:riboflavin kinase/FMN adenylyltransferase